METTSAGLLDRLKEPNPGDAWRRMVSVYGPLVFQWAKARRLSSEDAADLVQEVFMTLLRELPVWKYDPNLSFRSWLRTIVERRAIDVLRRNARQANRLEELDVQEITRPATDDLFVEQEYRSHLIRTSFDSIRSEFQPQVWQAAFRQLVNAEPATAVARELQISINATYLAKSRVLARLRQILAELPE